MVSSIITNSKKEEKIKTFSPLIVSASRATDIPAFYADWLINKFEKNYCLKQNPFNQKFEYISLNDVRFIVFWSKNPENIVNKLSYFDSRGINYYFQFTLNDYEAENYEINIPKLDSRISIFKNLSDTIGKDKIVWRFDPLILSEKINLKQIIEKVINLGDKISSYTNKLIFSFVDLNYQKVVVNLKKYGCNFRNFSDSEKVEFAKTISDYNTKNWHLEIATCAEKNDFSELNIHHNKCIDDKLILKLSENDLTLKNYLNSINPSKIKDKGQRKLCNCIVSKDLGAYNTCPHFCVYCYANSSENIVKRNFENFDKNNDSIVKYF